MIRKETDDIIAFLNSLVEVDSNAINLLVGTRVPCNEDMADHPTVQVGMGDSGLPVVGILGVLNGYCGIRSDYNGPIMAVFEDDGTLIRFCNTDEFIQETKEND